MPKPSGVTPGRAATGATEAAVETAESEGVHANTRIVAGPAASLILAEAESAPGAIVAMGTHGRGGFRRFLLGSVTDKVVRSADVPVLAVPPGAEHH